jgi:excisionase family DNA binding protein
MNDPDPCLNTEQVALELGISKSGVRGLIRSGSLEAERLRNGHWCIRQCKLNEYKLQHPGINPSRILVRDTGMIEVSIGLTAAAAAIMTLIPPTLRSPFLRAALYWISLVIGFVSLYASLWLLAEFAEDNQGLRVRRWEETAGIGHIIALLTNLNMGPYWFIAISLVLLFAVLGLAGYASAF